MVPRFSPLTAQDISAALQLIEAFYQEDTPDPIERNTLQQRVERLIANTDYGGIWLINLDHKPIGYVVVCMTFSIQYGRDAVLDELYVQPEYRGKGIGSAAVQFAEAYCREKGCEAIHLEVYAGNPAVDLYRRLGYTEHDSTWMTKWF